MLEQSKLGSVQTAYVKEMPDGSYRLSVPALTSKVEQLHTNMTLGLVIGDCYKLTISTVDFTAFISKADQSKCG
jgi:hypothetical protein